MRKKITIRNHIAQKRRQHGFTQETLATISGVRVPTIKKLEAVPPVYTPSIHTLRKLAGVLDCQPMELLDV